MPHAYSSMCRKKNCLASILNLASLSKAFLLISVRPGPCAYSLDQSLGTGCHTVFGLGKHSTSYCKEPTRFGRVLSLSLAFITFQDDPYDSLIQLLYLANITILQAQHVHLYPSLFLESQNLKNGKSLYRH